ncbi:MAG: LysR family transcriptional regulator, partial [Hyphococcus sp.]
MNSRELQYFLTAFDLGGPSKAARQLHVAQSAVTRSVQKLEAELGVALFAPLGRSVTPTPAGRFLAARAR